MYSISNSHHTDSDICDSGYFWSLADKKRGSGLGPEKIVIFQWCNLFLYVFLLLLTFVQHLPVITTIISPEQVFTDNPNEFSLGDIFFPSWVSMPIALGFISFYQFLPQHRDRTVNVHFGIVDRLRGYFMAALVSNILWFMFLNYKKKELALLAVIFNWAAGMVISLRRLRKTYPGLNPTELTLYTKNKFIRNLLRFSFDFYLGLITIRVGSIIALIFSDRSNDFQSILSISIQCVCFFMSFILYGSHQIMAFSIPVAWALIAVGATVHTDTVALAGYILGLILTIFVVIIFTLSLIRQRQVST